MTDNKNILFDKNKELILYQSGKKLYNGIKKEIIKKKFYSTHFNGGKPLVIILNNNRSVDVYVNISDMKHVGIWMYAKTIKYKKIFIGKSEKNNTTIQSKGYGSKFDGNTILLQLTTNTYALLHQNISIFKIFNDTIIKYLSPVGNNDFPYNYAVSKKNYYFFFENRIISISDVIGDPIDYLYSLKKSDITKLRKIKMTNIL
jgi:hypothetical protein